MKAERSLYKEICNGSAESLEELYGNNVPPPAIMIPPNTNRATIHYSFDMAQQVLLTCQFDHVKSVLQVHYPLDPFQPGPIYFLTPRKCAIFGICCEGMPRQVSKPCNVENY